MYERTQAFMDKFVSILTSKIGDVRHARPVSSKYTEERIGMIADALCEAAEEINEEAR